MDHLPLCDEGLASLGAMPVFDEVPYDNLGFWGFPQRHGWADTELDLGLLRGNAVMLTVTPRKRQQSGDMYQDPSLYASLIQSWWYFGLLNAVLQRPIEVESYFTDGPDGFQVLTTRNLAASIDTLKREMEDLPPDDARKRLEEMRRCINFVHGYIQSLASRIDKFRSEAVRTNEMPRQVSPDADFRTFQKFYWARYGRKILPHKLEMAICALGHTMDHAVRAIWIRIGLGGFEDPQCPRPPRWYIPTSLRLRIKDQGFCRLDYERFKTSLGFLGACMLSTYDRTQLSAGTNHSRCARDRCVGDDVDRTAYQQQHAQDGCKCPMVMPKHVHTKILDIVHGGGIPVVRAALSSQDEESDLEFEVLEGSSGHNYIAFSHVWAHGRGNTKGNALHRCQWLYLQERALQCLNPGSTMAQRRLSEMPPFWLDTVCIPCGPNDPLVTELRPIAILQMPQIYRKAEKVLVLDKDLESNPKASPLLLGKPYALNMQQLDLSMRVTMSSWMRRLWTMHEGAVASSVMLQTAEGAIDLKELGGWTNQLLLECYGNNKLGILQGLGAWECSMIWNRCLSIPQQEMMDDRFIFMFSWAEARRRSTSVFLDRYLVMGIMNNIPKSALLDLQRNKQDAEDIEAAARNKLKVLLLTTPSIPSSIIFTPWDHFSDPGLGWAPTSLDAPLYEHQGIGTRKEEGLLVKYKGWQLSSSVDWTRLFLLDVSVIHPVTAQGEHRGRVFEELGRWKDKDLSAIRAATHQDLSSARCAFIVHVPSGNPSNPSYFNVNVKSKHWNPANIDASKPLAIILAPSPDNGSIPRPAILVEKNKTDSGTIFVKFLVDLSWFPLRGADLEMAMVSRNEDIVQEVEATWLNNEAEQDWCVG